MEEKTNGKEKGLTCVCRVSGHPARLCSREGQVNDLEEDEMRDTIWSGWPASEHPTHNPNQTRTSLKLHIPASHGVTHASVSDVVILVSVV